MINKEQMILDMRIYWHGVPVLLTKQIAELYGCSVDQIKQNFGLNKERFVEGKHYFVLTGEALKLFKSNNPLVGKNASCIYLWTRYGALRHTKFLHNEKA